MYKKVPRYSLLIALAIVLMACSQGSTLSQGQTAAPHNLPATEAALPEVEATSLPAEAPVAGQAEMGEAAYPKPEMQKPGSVDTTTDGYAYTIVDTGQDGCYSDTSAAPCPAKGQAFYGQDAQYQGVQARYVDNGDGTVSDLNTGLMWQQTPDTNGDGQIDVNDKMTYETALKGADSFSLAGYDDWRLPTIKELYSLIDFRGVTSTKPYLDTDYFGFGYGDTSAGERDIDAQFASSTVYVSKVMNGEQAVFGVNFADGRIKGYGIGVTPKFPQGKTFYVLYVRGNSGYGANDFVDNGNGTIGDRATGLTWMQADSGEGLNWEEALNYCESLDLAGQDDWRLPNAKELQSIVDYTRSPDTTGSAAIDPLFQATLLADGVNHSGQANYPHYWTSTTHLDGRPLGSRAVYLAFGEARGFMDLGGSKQLMDVHGAGAQRSDQKSGDPASLPVGFGPQGDVQSIYNYARCVRGGVSEQVLNGGEVDQTANSQPAGPQPGGKTGQGQPPQAAIQACNGLAAGAACTISGTPSGDLTGSCLNVPTGDLACVPEGGGPGGNGGGQRP